MKVRGGVTLYRNDLSELMLAVIAHSSLTVTLHFVLNIFIGPNTAVSGITVMRKCGAFQLNRFIVFRI